MMMFSIVDQLVFWTYGIWLSTERCHGHGHVNWRSFVSPNTISIVLALVFVMAEIPIFEPLQLGLSTVSSATTGMCMLYLGALASFSRVLPALKRPELYIGIVVKMVMLPVLAGRLIIMTGIFPEQMVLALTIIMALPVMTVVPMVVANNGKEYEYATGITVVTLVVSIVTIPLVVFLVGL